MEVAVLQACVAHVNVQRVVVASVVQSLHEVIQSPFHTVLQLHLTLPIMPVVRKFKRRIESHRRLAEQSINMDVALIVQFASGNNQR